MANIRRIILWLAIVIALIAALIYGGNLWWLHKYGSSSQPIPTAILDIDKSFKHLPQNFPPDPGKAGKKTIQGIDADHDGIRDDVQRWIYAYVPNEPKKQMALRQLARYFQQYALADVNGVFDNRDQAKRNLDQLITTTRSSLSSVKNLQYDLAWVENSSKPLQLAEAAVQRGVDDFQRYWLWLYGLEKAPSWFETQVQTIVTDPSVLNGSVLPRLKDHLA